MSKTVLEKAAIFISENNYDTIDKPALEVAKRAILDYFGCAVAGQREEIVQRLLLIPDLKIDCGKCTVLAGNNKYSPANAAMINATAGHALDFDDTSWTTIAHPTTVAAPVALAEAERLNLTGKDILAAYSIGVEVAHTLARMTMPAVSERGWHTTSVYGTIAAAAVSAWMRKLTLEETINALGIAMSRASGIRSNFGSMTKPLHAGLAAKAGIECVNMAEVGITASSGAFEANDGFIDCYGSRDAFQNIDFGHVWDLAENGLAFKMYPCCSGAHPTLDLLSDLMQQGELNAQDINSIHAGVSLLGPRELVNHSPKTPLEARFSLEYAIATMLLRGKFTLDELTEEAVLDADIQAFMHKVEMNVDADLAKLGFIGTAPVKLRIFMKDGRVLERSNDLARGNPEKPFSDRDFSEKFMGNATRFLSDKQSGQLLDLLFTLENQSSIADLMTLACKSIK